MVRLFVPTCLLPELFLLPSFCAVSSVPFFLLFGFASPPPYFSSSSRVESYLVASFSFWMVLARSACWSLSRVLRLSTRRS